jgi:formyltetrahydrofolate deformylase
MNAIVFLIQCPDRKGLVSRISTFFYERGFNILHCQQHTDTEEGRFFMRVKVDPNTLTTSRHDLEEGLAALARELDLTWSVRYHDFRPRVAIMVTKASHCLYDLLLRQKEGELECEIPVIISNHPDLEHVADTFRIPYHCLPVTKETKPQQEAGILALLDQCHIDLVVMARYMQILSDDFIERRAGRIINIHHAFLPAFMGANPYRRAYERGVKLIGATAHYATADLDEGPIVEQDVQRVTHEDTPADLTRIGRDIERVVLARAVKAHLEHRVIVSGRRAVVFSAGG